MTKRTKKSGKPKSNEPKPNTAELLPFDEYDVIIVSFSGGKDSLACVLDLIERGVPKEKIQLWHQCIDGGEDDASFMDWPITESYCEAIAEHLGIRLLFQWRDQGFKGEMLRWNDWTKGVYFETQDGEKKYVGPDTKRAKSTRRKFPQTSANLQTRWCSSSLKIDVCKRAINNDPKLKTAKILLVTGERREESANRARYAEIEVHGCNGKRRTVHQWRSVIEWSEEQVWEIMKRYSINPHPAYHLGFGRVSCFTCIFADKDQWATIREMDPQRFGVIRNFERDFDCTIHRTKSVEDQANEGAPFEQIVSEKLQRRIALAKGYPTSMVKVESWKLPAGAGRASACGGPS